MKNSDFLSRFHQFVKKHQLFSNNDHLLLAFSGGLDSSVLFHCLIKSGYTFDAAHVNYHLRGEDSNKDEIFVEKLCRQYKIKLHKKHIFPVQLKSKSGYSIEMAAREFRYQWFAELCQQKGYNRVLLAHHQNDQAETLLLNLIRGCGVKGLAGMPVVRQQFVRPLMAFTREEIKEFARENNIEYRLDQSNLENNYQRNQLRNVVIPEIEKINPSFVKSSDAFTRIFRSLDEKLSVEKSKFLNEALIPLSRGEFLLNKKFVLQTPGGLYFLYEILKDFQVNIYELQEIIHLIQLQPGKKWKNQTYEFINDREFLFIRPHKPFEKEKTYIISRIPSELETEEFIFNFDFTGFPVESDLKNPDYAYLDYSRIVMPLRLRKWNKGDIIIPFGMTGEKKISDILTDKKFPLWEKEKVWVVEDSHEIIWIAGVTINNKFKINDKTGKILKIVRLVK